MAELQLFHFQPVAGPVHRIDGRSKLLLVISIVVSIFSCGTAGLTFVTLVLLTAARLIPLHPRHFLREFAFFAVLALIIFFTHPEKTEGAVAAWRFLLVVLTGMELTSSTSPEEIHAVVFTLLAPLPLVPHGRIAEHVSLTFLFIPLLFDSAKEIVEARKSRLVNRSGNPIRRLSSLAAPLLEILLVKIEETSLALESRGYNEEAVRHRLNGRPADILIALAGMTASALLVLFA